MHLDLFEYLCEDNWFGRLRADLGTSKASNMLTLLQTVMWLFVAAETSACRHGHDRKEEVFWEGLPFKQSFPDEIDPWRARRGVHAETFHPEKDLVNVKEDIQPRVGARHWNRGSRFENGGDKQLNLFDDGASLQKTNEVGFTNPEIYGNPTFNVQQEIAFRHGTPHITYWNSSFGSQDSETFVGDNIGGQNETPPMMNNIIIETIQSSSGTVVNQLNRRCDALDLALNMQYKMIGELASQPGRHYVEQHPTEQGSFSDCKSQSNKIVQEILITVQGLSRLLHTFQQDFTSKTTMMFEGSRTNTQYCQTSRDSLISSISGVSQQMFQRFEEVEKRMQHQEKTLGQLLNNQQTVAEIRGAFVNRVDSFMTTMYRTSEAITAKLESMVKDFNVMRQTWKTQPNQMNPSGSVLHIESVEKKLETLLRKFIEKRTETSVQTEKAIKDIHKDIQLLIKHEMSPSVGPEGLRNRELSVEIQNQLSKMNEYIKENVSSASLVQSSMEDIRNILGKGIQPCGSGVLTQSSLEGTLTKVIAANSQKLNGMFQSVQADLRKCCANPNSLQKNDKHVLEDVKTIHGICSNVSGFLTELKPLLSASKGQEIRSAAKDKAQQEEWKAMMAAFQGERLKMSAQLEMYKKALDDRVCLVEGKIQKWSPNSAAKNYTVTQKPISFSRSTGEKNGTKVVGKTQKWTRPPSSKNYSVIPKPLRPLTSSRAKKGIRVG